MQNKKGTVGVVISLILSFFMFIFNICTFYVFLLAAAFSSAGTNKQAYLQAHLSAYISFSLIIFMLITFIFSIIVLVKLKKSNGENISKFPKKTIIAFIVILVTVFILNLIIGIINITQVTLIVYLVSAILFLIASIFEIICLKQTKQAGDIK